MDMDTERRIRLRLRTNLYFHALLTMVLQTLAALLFHLGTSFYNNFHLFLFTFNLFCLLIKIILYKQDFGTIRRFFWVFGLIDISIISLAYYLTKLPFNYMFPFYLIIIFSTAREIVPGEVKLVTILSILGFSTNIFLLWKNGYIIYNNTGSAAIHLDFTVIVAFASLLFTATITYFISRQDYKYMKSMKNILLEKEDHLKRLNEVNASLEEKYAASYTLSLIQQYIHHELYESKLLTKITDIVQGVLGSAFTAIYGLTKANTLDLLAFSGVKDFTSLLHILKDPEKLPYKALEEQRLLGEETAKPADIKLLQKHDINSILCIPLYTKEGKIGVLTVSHFQEKVFKNDQRELLQIIGNQLSLAMENIKLHQATEDMAWHDQLTSLYNRAYFNNYLEALKKERARAERPLSFSCLIFDIDHFKQVNDLHGHLVGDEVLKVIASTLKNNTDQNSIAVRYGGEEFLILSTTTNLKFLKELADKIRMQISLLEFNDNEGVNFRVTISGGIAAIPEHAETTEEVLQKADEALYQAKESGRNRIIIYE